MIVIGLTLLFIGFLLCLSIAWVPVGFFAMGFGLICLLMAEKRNKPSKARLERPTVQNVSEPSPFSPAANLKVRQEGAAPERENWNLLVDNDPELARVEKVLSQYGPQYVDQLVKTYVLFNNKSFLPIIIKMIVASARLPTEGNARNVKHRSVDVEFDGCQVDENGLSVDEKRPSDPQFLPKAAPLHQQMEIGPDTDEDRSEGRADKAPARPEIETSRGIEPVSLPLVDADGTDELKRLFDKLTRS